ncbi:hypothetical protein FHL15_006559 [Xylaria flabelliformis]|uniref:Zn(2)-C6 fungal-type domain-containing protein n=1 Tax=Xylaria flabelliformis TaxID=2512241 RepID=A0A553HXF3_9PEZI|nr:hypothetical protein FHL15_006559 [Xylaria flabelliformis]
MTRPKVDPDKRQRTAQACDSCKRRKQKCNGVKPCNTCTKRHLDCQYTSSTSEHSGSQDSPPSKRRHVDDQSHIPNPPNETGQGATRNGPPIMPWNQCAGSGGIEAVLIKTEHKQIGMGRPLLGEADIDFDSRSKLSNASVAADEAEVYPQNRMLQDSTGRLLYIGDSATLSYLQWIRFIEVFNKHAFLNSVDECYKDPLAVTPSLLCLLYLVFAIGLVMAAPSPGSDEAAVIDKLRSERSNRAELFFRSAKSLADPVSGFEDADFWSIQALLLMSLYMLSISKRNASYAYYGMAVRSAFALGLHREESMEVFQPEERMVRRNLWRTLFILDRFLSACLGRPTAISEEDCSNMAFEALTTPISSPTSTCPESTHLVALEAAVKTCQVIGMTLKRVYSKRKISTAVGQECATHLDAWNKELPPSLHWRKLVNGPDNFAQGIAILHINLLHCHSVMLLTRPYFLCLLNKSAVGLVGSSSKPSRYSQRTENFAQTCVEASQHTLVLTQAALDAKHCVFAAALIVLSNEFASLYHNPDARQSINSAISILRFCAQNDKQAERVSYIVESFDKANEQRTPSAKRLYLPGRKTPTLATLSQNSNLDPVGRFFRSRNREAISITTTSAANRETVVAATAPPPISSIPMIPSSMQQPSPDGNLSVSSGVTNTAGISQGVDDMEFDLDSIWNGWREGSNIPAAVHHTSTFGPFNLDHSQVHPVGPNVMYHRSDFG